MVEKPPKDRRPVRRARSPECVVKSIEWYYARLLILDGDRPAGAKRIDYPETQRLMHVLWVGDIKPNPNDAAECWRLDLLRMLRRERGPAS